MLYTANPGEMPVSNRAIWMISSNFYPVIGGSERQLQRIAHALVTQYDERVVVITRRHGNNLSPELPTDAIIDGIPVHRVDCRSRRIPKLGTLLFVINALLYLLRHSRNDFYHAHDEYASAWIAVLARILLGGQSILKLRTGRLLYQQVFGSGLRRVLFYGRLRLANQIVVVNSEVAGLLTTNGIPMTHIVRIPNGVVVDYFRPPDIAERTQERQRLAVRDDQHVVVCVGRLEYWKGVDVLVEGWRELADAVRSRLALIVVGDGSTSDQVAQRIVDWQLTDAIRMVGLQEDIRRYYWAADCLILPSRTEGLSNTLLEGMACGLLPLASKVGGALDLVRDGENGWLFETEDPADLARAVSTMWEAKDHWGKLREQARADVMAYADMRAVVEQYRVLYGKLQRRG